MNHGGPAVDWHHRIGGEQASDRRSVRIDISDTGGGIPPDVLPRIFEPFFTTKAAGSGTGLGLSISQSILQKMGGEMRVHTQLGHGTTFTLLLPVEEGAVG